MRIIIGFVLVTLVSQAHGQTNPKWREARSAAEAIVRGSGAVRLETSRSHTPAAWRANYPVAGLYVDYAQRERFVRPSHPWFYPHAYGHWSYLYRYRHCY